MNNFAKTTTIVMLGLSLVFAFSTPGSADVRVGVISSQTSGLAILGRRQINSAILAAEEWNVRGGIKGEKVNLVIEDSAVDQCIEKIIEAAKTGKIGDGKIFVSEVERVIRIRTGEEGEQAV